MRTTVRTIKRLGLRLHESDHAGLSGLGLVEHAGTARVGRDARAWSDHAMAFDEDHVPMTEYMLRIM